MTSPIADQFTYPRIRSCDLSHQMPRTNCRHRSCRGYRRGDERERQIERERRHPRFSSRDVNNDRNGRIRLPRQPPRVTSGPDWVASLSLLRTAAAASRDLDRQFGSLRCADVTVFEAWKSTEKKSACTCRSFPLFPISDLFPFPIPSPSFPCSGSWPTRAPRSPRAARSMRVAPTRVYQRGGCACRAYLHAPDLRRRMTHRERSRQILSFRSACPTFRRDDPFYRANGAPCKIEARGRTPKIQHHRVPPWRTEVDGTRGRAAGCRAERVERRTFVAIRSHERTEENGKQATRVAHVSFSKCVRVIKRALARR